MRIGDRRISRSDDPFVIAEIGVNHDGDASRACDLVRSAAASGADAVKLQWFEADRLVGDSTAIASYQRRSGVRSQLDLLRDLELEPDAMAEVIEVAHGLGMLAVVSVFSVESVAAATRLEWDAWKTASPDIVHRPLLERLAADGRPMIVSSGGASLEEVGRAMGWIRDREFGLLHCVSAYPTPIDQATLHGVKALEEATSRPCGYSDHTSDLTTGGLAIAAGATILEKHLTWSRDAVGPDHMASIEPDDFKTYTEFARRAHAAMGAEGKAPSSVEADVMAVARQSVRAAEALVAGRRIQAEDLVMKRPGDGIEPWRLHEVVGRVLRRDLDPDEVVRPEDLE